MLTAREMVRSHSRITDLSEKTLRVTEKICTVLDSEEVIREVWERMGLEINFREGIDRIREVEEAQ